jgi:hypothetical protein
MAESQDPPEPKDHDIITVGTGRSLVRSRRRVTCFCFFRVGRRFDLVGLLRAK